MIEMRLYLSKRKEMPQFNLPHSRFFICRTTAVKLFEDG